MQKTCVENKRHLHRNKLLVCLIYHIFFFMLNKQILYNVHTDNIEVNFHNLQIKNKKAFSNSERKVGQVPTHI